MAPIAAFRQCRAEGLETPDGIPMAYRAAPAARNRDPAMRKGGIVSIAIRMAR
jgi:hypothetical protein